jgi:hypothetical protein
MKQVTATLKTGDEAKRTVDALAKSSFPSDEISVLRVDHDEVASQPVVQKTGIPRFLPVAIALGAAAGAILALTGALHALGLVSSPATIERVLAAGAIGAGAGVLVGIYGGLGRWKIGVDVPAKDPEGVGYLVGVPVSEERAQEVQASLETEGVTGVSVGEGPPDPSPGESRDRSS